MKSILIVLMVICVHSAWTQNEWHVKPYTNNYAATGDGLSVATAWSLQYALSGGLNGTQVQPGDIIWLHGDNKLTYAGTPTANAVYKGHFRSTVVGGNAINQYITVSSYPGEWAVLDGNIHFNPTTPLIPTVGGITNSDEFILEVIGGNVRFQNFEVTCLGNFSRIKDMRPIVTGSTTLCAPTNPPAYLFHEYVGIQHAAHRLSPIRNEFRNLVFRNIPGIALGSWKFTSDTEIYGNIFYNNGIIEVFAPVGCTPLQDVPLTPSNCRGHQTCIYTQNATNVDRIIRNNIFLNCYDSAVNIWSALNATDIVNNYVVSKNSFINNGSPVFDETANMIVSANGGRINDIDVFNNLFYRGDYSNGVSGLKVDFVTNINMRNNYFFNGTTFMQIYETNHNVNFNNNFYVGKYFQLKTSINNYKGTAPGLTVADRWHMNNNQYFTWNNTIFEVPNLIGTGIERINHSQNTSNPTLRYFKNTTDYNDELNSTWAYYENKRQLGVPPAARYFIVQNQYNPNVFYVSVYNPTFMPLSASAFEVNFDDYEIPVGRTYRVKDSQNLMAAPIAQGTYTATNVINLPIPAPSTNPLNPGNFELPLPTPAVFATYGPAYIPTTAPPVHSNQDFNTYVIEFDCNLTYNKYDDFKTGNDNTSKTYLAKHNINFGPNYSTSTGADVNATAGNQILIKSNSWIIGNNAKFFGRIGDPCTDIAFNAANDAADFDMGADLNRNSIDYDFGKTGKENKVDFTIYPNPSAGVFTIETLKSENISHVMITKLNDASLVYEASYDNLKNISLDISKEVSGLYTVQVIFEDNTTQNKTIIKK